MSEKNSNAFYRYVERYGHYCGPCYNGQYKMIPEWIDVDNKVWHEPYHLYGDKIYGWE